MSKHNNKMNAQDYGNSGKLPLSYDSVYNISLGYKALSENVITRLESYLLTELLNRSRSTCLERTS